MKRIIRIDNEGWCRCGQCGHKLFKTASSKDPYKHKVDVEYIISSLDNMEFEVKCHSCKALNVARRIRNGKGL
ncbi:MAG TPA: hypothetical protein DHV37_06035 [Erysipelotrichaceae bacterium]|nr:hypothetical protein [Erysipelotrichaceae bacterium]